MIRVLISEFEPIMSRGLRDVLERGGCELISDAEPLTPAVLTYVKPDAVIVEMETAPVPSTGPDESAPAPRRAGSTIAALACDFPAIQIIECSSSDPLMRVFPAFRRGQFVELPLSADTLLRAVTGP